MIEQAQEHFERGDFASAFDLYRQMLDDEPENHEVLFMMSLCRQRQQNLPEAAEYLAQAVLYHPTQALYHYSLGSVRLRLGQVQAALESYTQAAHLNPNYAAAHVGVGYIHLIQQRYSQAETAMRAALRADPRVAGAHAHLGVALLQQDRVEEALQVLRESAELYPDDPYTQTQLGRALMRSQMYAFAAQCFRNALAKNAQEPTLWLWLGQSLAASGDAAEAAEALRHCLERGGESAEALFSLGQLYLSQGEAQGALNLLLRVIHLQPQSLEARLNAVRACRLLQRFELAQELLQPCADDDQARKMLARLALDQHRPEQARAHLAALALAGVDDSVVQLMLAESALQQGDWPRMGEMLAPLLAQGKPLPAALLLEAQRLYHLGDAAAAQDVVARIDGTPQGGLADELRDWRVRILHAAGQVDAAWQAARGHANRQAGLVVVCGEPAPEGVVSEAVASGLVQDIVWSWPVRGPEDEQPDPILIYGWPGSGRESLLTALAAQPGVKVLRDTVAQQAERRAALCWPRGAQPLSALSEADVRLRRRRYWREVRRVAPRWEDLPLVDSLWFSAAALPTLYRLFPTARVIVVQRDEKELRMDWALGGYRDLDAMLQAWQAEQALLQQALEVLPLQWIPVDHGALRDNGADTLQALTQFLPGVDAAQLAERTLRVSAGLEMPAGVTAADEAHLADAYNTA